MDKRSPPWWLWPNLLSLDAPLVAVVWLWMLTRAWRIQQFPVTLYVALAGAVWCIYVLDRFLDTKFRERSRWSRRHEFYARHWPLFRWALLVVAGLVVVLGLSELSVALMGYLVPAGLLCAVYFSLTIFSTRGGAVSYGKNLVAALTFAYGTALCAHVELHSQGVVHLIFSPVFLYFALVCLINMVAVDLWEAVSRGEEEGLFAEVSLSPALALLGFGAVMGYLEAQRIEGSFMRGGYYMDEYYMALLISAGGLLALNHFRERFSLNALRVLGDVALVVPVVVFILA